jgi:cell division protein FtsB
MPTTGHPRLDIILYCVAAGIVLFIGYRIGRMIGAIRASRQIALREQELFTTQKGFKTLYEQELGNLRSENAKLTEQVQQLNARVEDYRKKAAGFGGLFTSGGKKADAMYALLLENEALEEALYSQNEKLKQERTDALKESMRNTGYRRVLMSQLLNDERIKGYVAEIINDNKRLPGPGTNGSGHAEQKQLPSHVEAPVQGTVQD